MLKYIPESHTYYLDGKEIPGTTQVLQAAGFTYAYYRDGDNEIGNYGHQVMAMIMGGADIDSIEVDPRFGPYIPGIKMFLAEQLPQPRAYEMILHSRTLCYAGTLDFFGMIQRWAGAESLLDWKFWKSVSKSVVDTAGLQTAGYSKLAKGFFELKREPRRAAVHFFPGGYRIYPTTDRNDWTYFLSALNCYHWRINHYGVEK